jgi:hypothetical protein
MLRFRPSMSLGKGSTHAHIHTHTLPECTSQHGIRSRDLGGHFITGKSAFDEALDWHVSLNCGCINNSNRVIGFRARLFQLAVSATAIFELFRMRSANLPNTLCLSPVQSLGTCSFRCAPATLWNAAVPRLDGRNFTASLSKKVHTVVLSYSSWKTHISKVFAPACTFCALP